MRTLSKLSAESAYAQLKVLIASAPADPHATRADPETQLWLGRVSALVKDTLGAKGTIALDHYKSNLRSNAFGPAATHDIMALLYEALAFAELELPPGAQGAFIPAGNAFDAMSAVSRIFATTTKDLFVIDPYFDEKFLIEFAQLAQEGVTIRLLGDSAGVRPTFLPATRTWQTQFGATRPLIVRLAPARSLHDRLIMIDNATVWTLGQSFNALATRAPTSFNKSDPDTAGLKQQAFAAIWDAAVPV